MLFKTNKSKVQSGISLFQKDDNYIICTIEKHNKELSIIYDKVYKNFLDSRNKIMPIWEKIESKVLNNKIH